ncbi:hypothetical protein [Thermomonospora cellulosilytica]|uniref:Uncharacterized protein n=1 Tax=Thermomonospora cellulosilytica TaxID=1411118 RepID=A0A7W3MXI1_9ACTN|nr:hypothetical protein [Thermomonospora cellulosilytica]MBA9003664.1 hypothetical protein [Thermomonospora cellulosilytica]
MTDIIGILQEIGYTLPDITIEPHQGRGPYGDVWGPAVVVPAFVDQQTRLIRADDGSQVTSRTTVYTRLDVVCPPRSRITIPDGTPEGVQTLVIAALRRDAHGQPDLPEHLEIVCE